MKIENEVEYKSVVTEQKFADLYNFFGKLAKFDKTYLQVNHYFDDEKLSLAKEGITLRIRHKKDSNNWELTAKLPKGTDALYSESGEINEKIDEEIALFLIENGIDAKNEFIKKVKKHVKLPKHTFKCLGKLETERSDFKFFKDTISLDKSFYNGITDYEMEWETTNHDFVQPLLKQLGIQVKNAKGKRKRFLASLKTT